MKTNFKKNGGFTLVELIVVIAILAILAAVAVPAYSGYIEKANKQNDISLIRDIKQALELYAYSNPGVTSAVVKIGPNGAIMADNAAGKNGTDENGVAAMEAVFGENWQEVVALKYADWKGDSGAASYGKTNYYGSEKKLLGDIEGLTGALGVAIQNMPDLVGDGFEDFLKDYKLNKDNPDDIDAIADAAVLYVADQTVGKEEVIQEALESALLGNLNNLSNNMITNLKNKGMNEVAALAVVYASLEGLAQANDKTLNVNLIADPGQTMNATLAAERLDAAYQDLLVQCGNNALNYIDSTKDNNIYTDLAGYVGVMNTVSSNKTLVDSNLGQTDTFTNDSLVNTIRGYADAGHMGITTKDGEVAVILVNGLVSTLPVQIG